MVFKSPLGFHRNFCADMSNGFRHFYEFGDFRLDAGKRILWRRGEIVPLAPKAAEVLLALVEKRGDVLGRTELLDKVWKDTFVEEGNINYTISNLRRTLGKSDKNGFIQTVPRRGYRFTAKLSESWDDPESEIVIERNMVSETVIEEIHTSGEPIRQTVPREFLGTAAKRSGLRTAVSIAVVVSTLAIVAAWRFGGTSGETRRPVRSIAVLPFKAIDDNSRNKNRGLGLADILVTRLSGLRKVAVRPMSSVASIDGNNSEPVDLGKQIGVDAVLEGTVYQTGEDLRVTVRFVDVNDGKAIWTGEFAKPLSDELLLQSEIALRVADGLALNLAPEERRRITKRYTDNRDAYEAYLRGRFYYDKRDPEFDPKAIAEFEKAIQLDPNYALAFVGLADVYPAYAERIPEKRVGRYEYSKSLLEKALALDDELPEAHTSLAWIKRIHEWDWDGSESEFKRALELDPNSYNAHMWYALLLVTLSRKDEALAEIEKAKELAPLTPSVIANYHTVRYFCRDNDKLLEIAEQERKLGVREYVTARTLSQTYLRLGEFEKVIETVTDFYSRNGSRRYETLDANLATAFALGGRMKEAEPLLRRLKGEASKSAEAGYRLSAVLADLGRSNEALELLEKCLAERDARLMWISVEPRFDRLRSEPRFQAILKKMNLPSA